MPNVAIQDYIVIDVANLSSITTAEKAEILAKAQAGTALDCVLQQGQKKCKVVGVDFSTANTCKVYFANGATLTEISIATN